MSENIVNDDRRHAISKLAGPMNDPLIDPVDAIRRVSENIAYCENWGKEHDERLKREEEREKRAKTIEADWEDILEANKQLVSEIKSKVNGEDMLSASEILERQKQEEKKLKSINA